MKTASTRSILLFLLPALFCIKGFAQTKGFIYQPSTNSTIRAVLDPNGDGYTSLNTTGFSGTNDFGSTYSELGMVALPSLFNEQSGDIVTGATGGHTDIVSNSNSHGVSVLVKTVSNVQYLIIRFRIGKASTASKGYSLLIDSDATFGTYLSSNNPGYDREIIMETGNPGNVKIYQHTATTTTLQTYSAAEYSQRSIAASVVDGDADYFYDYCVPLSAINAASAVRITAATITSAQSGIGGTVSDFNGLPKYDNQFQAMKDITNTFPTGVGFTDMVEGYTFPSLKSVPPVVTSSLTTASTSVSGTSVEANGTTVTVYRNRGGVITTLGTTTVNGSNAWTLSSGVTGNLNAADLVYATVTASGRSESSASNSIEVASATCYTPRPAITARANGSQEISGTFASESGAAIVASTVQIRLYYENGTTMTEETTTAPPYYVTAGASPAAFTIKANQSQPTFAGRSYYVTATLSSCESGFSSPIVGSSGTVTSAPTINTTTILASASVSRSVQVTNNDASTSTLILYQNGVQIATQAGITTGSSHTFSYTGFIEGANIVARAQSSTVGNWLSGPSNSVVVTASATQTSTPSITGSYTAGSGKTVTGTCDEAAGTVISLYKAGTTLLGTTTVNVYGAWSISSLTLAGADVLTATAKASGKTLSATSGSVTVAAAAPGTPTITTTPILANVTTTISGTGGSTTGTVIVYLDGEQIGTATPDGSGNWSASVTASSLYKGGTVTAKNSVSNVLGNASTGVVVTGVTSFLVKNTSDANIGDQTAGTPFNIKITAKDAAAGGGSTFTNYSSTNSVGATYALTSGSTTTSFTAGVLSSHSLTVTTAGTYTLVTLASGDPTIAGTSNSFTVNPAAANKLIINTAPSTQNSPNTNLGTQPSVHVTDTYSNRRTADNSGTVTVSILTGPTGGVLSGTTTASVTNGIADFTSNNLKMNRPGQYVLRFTSSAGLTSVDSDPIYVGRVWQGTGSNDFNTNGNWSGNTIPGVAEDIAFAENPTNDLYLDANKVIGDYYNYSANGKKLILNGKKLTIQGSINHNAASINAAATNSEVEFAGSSAQSIAASTFVGDSAYKITVNNSNGVSLGGTLKVTGEVKPTAGVFATNGHLTLRSYSIQNTAVISQGDAGGGYITGEVTIERYFPPKRAYRLISVPVTTSVATSKPYIRDNWQEGVNNTQTGYGNNQNPVPGYGTHISGPQGSAAGFDVTQSTNSSLFIWNNATQSWTALTNTNATTITAGATYRLMIRGDRSIDYSTNTPTPTYTVLRTKGLLAQGNQSAVSLSSTANGWNIVGNPYQSQVDIEAVTSSNLKTFYYVWDVQRGTRGAWVTYDFTTGSNDLSSEVNQYVQPGQAFFMQTSANGASSITFNEAHKNNTNSFTRVYRTSTTTPKLFVSLNYTDSLANNARSADGFMVAFGAAFNSATSDDVQKLGNLDENFSIEQSGELFSHEKRPDPAVNDSIRIHINQYTSQQYTIRLQWNNPIVGGPTAYLVDKYTNTEYPVNTSGVTDVNYTISASAPASMDARRFVIVFKNSGPLPVSGIEINARKSGDGIKVNWTGLNEQGMKHYEVEESKDGRNFTKAATVKATGNGQASTGYSWYDANVNSGNNYYRVKGISDNGREQFSSIVKVNLASVEAAVFTVTPNPVVTTTLQAQANNLEQGKYELVVFSADGRMITSLSVNHAGGSSNYSMELPAGMAKGIYHLKITGESYVSSVSFKVN